MNSTARLVFLWTPWTLLIAVVAFVATAVCSYIAWRRSGYRRSIALLELLRLGIVALAGVLLNQPEWVEEYLPEQKPLVAVLWDDSGSMRTRDVVDKGRPAQEPASRSEAIAGLISEAAWEPLRERMEVTLAPFSGADPAAGTDMHAPLTEAATQLENLLGVVLLTDGDWNQGPPPVEAAARFRLKNVPVIGVPVGSATQLPDVELTSLDAPTFGVAGKAVRVPFTIESSLPREYVTIVTLKASDGSEVSKEVRVAPQGRTSDAILWRPAELGDYTVTLDVPLHSDETILDNNSREAPIAIREEKLNVLLIESFPRWEYRYLRNALSRDPGVEVACLLFHPGLSKVGGGSKDYIKSFPDGLDELSKFDVVFLGDVGLDDGQLTSEQCRLLAGLVEQQASGLVFLPGWHGRQFSLLETELSKLYPVALDESQTGGWGSRLPNHFALTALGRRSLLTKLADTQDENSEVWESLPGFQWYAPVLRSKAGTDVLCVHKDATNRFGRLPLLVTQTYGAGKVLFMGTDGAWRWRKGVEDRYHYRFWGQVVRWMAYQRNMAEGSDMRLFYTPDQPQVRQTCVLRANVMESSGEPLSKGAVLARILAPSGAAKTLRFTSTGEEWGAFSARFTPEEPGTHEVMLSSDATDSTLETTLFVQGSEVEPVGQPARPEVLEEIARVTGGQVLEVDQTDQIVNYLASLPDPPPMVRRLQVWNQPLVVGCVILLLGLFWVARKVVGLI